MGYRAWNNYEEDAERSWQAAVRELPWTARLVLRLRQFLVLALLLSVPALFVAVSLGLL